MRRWIRLGIAICCCTLVLAEAGCATRRREEFGRPRNVPSIVPLDVATYRISSHYGMRNGRPHKGVDLNVPKGTPVLAAADGIVLFAGKGRDFGRIVKLCHANGTETWYAHLKSFRVGERDRVRQGERIGRVGKSGNATGPHLHYEVHVKGQPVNPEPYLNGKGRP
ncbi:MAG: M23 family metallopeptidase [Candidatus Hydrogenedentes bacterium]|nr:M23 family metallopeptidase [Candidatus Hydrogenedentota bacterium]